ncbi:ArsI/CadI family heavy metal resistance metalloenzyme [Amycolatopsis sp. NPDC051071]|uniref:ArsI/CadI family heavy metal resistance metalloenzyme n=1 Tax=Amycolatopsis sp. NPDC051071 TaxID=3154637 RepID=UPI0034411AB2
MEIITYVAGEDELSGAQDVLDAVTNCGAGDHLAAVNLYGADLDGIPAVVLQVMRLKKTGAMPLTIADDQPIASGSLPDVALLEQVLRDGVTEPAVLVSQADSAVNFPTASRIHLSMFVNDLKESVAFYEVFFGQPPTKRRDDYAKFELEEPPLNIAFSQDRQPEKGVGAVNHLGIQVKSSDQILAARDRFRTAGFAVDEEIQTACCYAVQTKIWVGDPDGNRWEWFVTTQADADEGCGADCPCYSEIAPSRAGSAPASMPVSA